jgi:hypothetical protein
VRQIRGQTKEKTEALTLSAMPEISESGRLTGDRQFPIFPNWISNFSNKIPTIPIVY